MVESSEMNGLDKRVALCFAVTSQTTATTVSLTATRFFGFAHLSRPCRRHHHLSSRQSILLWIMLMIPSSSSALLRGSFCLAVLSRQLTRSFSFCLLTRSFPKASSTRPFLYQPSSSSFLLRSVAIRQASAAVTTNVIDESVTTMAPAETYPQFAQVPDLHPSLKAALAKMELVTMTEIQAKTWEAASAGQDVLGRARTGTGKTISFLLPALQQLLEAPKLEPNHVAVLILSPTRELAAQIGEQTRQLLQMDKTAKQRITHQVIVGGNPKPKDISAFERTIPTILVATPGRLNDHLQTTKVRGQSFAKAVSKTKILVLDETDRYVL